MNIKQFAKAFGSIPSALNGIASRIITMAEKQNNCFYVLKIKNGMTDSELINFVKQYNQCSLKHVIDIHEFYALTCDAPLFRRQLIDHLGGKPFHLGVIASGGFNFYHLRYCVEGY